MRSEALAGGASSSPAYASEHRGAGGKLRRPSNRKQSFTPYARPLGQQRRPGLTPAATGGWMSKIVNPAYRLIAGGAARFLPSVFSSSSANSLPAPLPPPPTDAAEEDDKYTEMEQETRNENQESPVDRCMSKSFADEGPSEQEERPDIFYSAEVARGKSPARCDPDGPDLSDIEQLIKGKTFRREEFDRLMGILQARVVDAEGGGHISNVSMTEKADEVEIPLGNPNSNEEKQEDIDEDRLASLTPLPQPTAKEDIGASPVELAKAYMGSRASEFDFGSKSLVLKNDRLLSHTNESPSNRFFPPPSPKPSICWPGAIVQEQHGYSTPHSQRGRYGLNSHPRTPYSRTIYSRSKSKLTPLEGDSRKFSDISATPFQKQTPYSESRIRPAEDLQGSVGPIRRLRQKFVSETPRRGSPSLWSSQKGSQVKESILGDNLQASKSIEPTTIGTSFQSTEHTGLSEGDTSIVHPQTSKLARQILEQISRTPTRKEKSEELTLVRAKKNSSTSEVSGTKNDAATTSYVGGFRPDKGRESPFFKVPSTNIQTGGINRTDSDNTSASKTNLKSSFPFINIRPSTTNKDSTQENEIPRPNKGPAAATNLPLAGTQVLNVPKAPTSGTKPLLPPIFVDKPISRVRFASDNCTSGFTFPVTAPFSSSEPPTPSMMPFPSATVVNPPSDDAKTPTYTFGEKKSASPLVFSFPSVSSASAQNDTPVFKFGSEGSRVSFSSVGKDAVCC